MNGLAWVREAVLAYKKRDRSMDDLLDKCACMWGPSGHCAAGKHQGCTGHTPTAESVETYLHGQDGQVFKVYDLRHPHVWRCDCNCHTGAEPVGQLELFGALA